MSRSSGGNEIGSRLYKSVTSKNNYNQNENKKDINLLVFTFTENYSQNIYCLNLDHLEFSNHDQLNKDIESKKIILLGEIHNIAVSSIIQAELMIHLNQRFGIRHLLIEFGHAEAYLYNQYLQTGDEWYLKYTFHGFNRYQEFYSSMKKLYEYNSKLDNNKKIVIHGLDFEREPGLSATLYSILSTQADYPEIESLLDSIRNRLDTMGIERNTKEFIYYLRDRVSSLSLRNDINRRVIDNILNNKSFYPILSKRDKYMVETFIELDSTNEDYFGQFGFAHTMLNTYTGFASVLNDLEKYQNKLLVINMMLFDSNTSHSFQELSDCSMFLYKIDPSDEKVGGYVKRGQWALILEDQKGYSQIKK